MPNYRPPAGFYQPDDVNYPRRQSAIGGVVNAQGQPIGVGSNMMGDPYTEEEIAAASRAPLMRAPGVPLPPLGASDPATATAMQRLTSSPTVLQPGRTSAFSDADAQSLQTLDPRALEEARKLESLSKPKTMTASFGGKSYEMTPNARVDRNRLAEIYSKYLGQQGREREDAVRSQEQSGRERIVSIPGEQTTKRRQMELEAEERITGKKLEADAPARAADLAAKQAQTAATTGAESRAQAAATRQPIQEQQAAIDAALAEAQASPFAQTPEGRARIAALAKLSTVGRAAPEAAAGMTGPARSVSDVGSEMLADPLVAAALKRARTMKAGHWTGSQGRREAAASNALLDRAIRDFAARNGVEVDELRPFLALAE